MHVWYTISSNLFHQAPCYIFMHNFSAKKPVRNIYNACIVILPPNERFSFFDLVRSMAFSFFFFFFLKYHRNFYTFTRIKINEQRKFHSRFFHRSTFFIVTFFFYLSLFFFLSNKISKHRRKFEQIIRQ